MKLSTTSSISPSRRTVVASSMRTKARSRGASAAKPVWRASTSSSGWLWSRQAIRISSAARREAREVSIARRYKRGWRSCHGPVCWGHKQLGGTAMKKQALALIVGLVGVALAAGPGFAQDKGQDKTKDKQ